MKHTEWLRLYAEGEKICATLQRQGYLCQKQARRLSWWVSKEGSNCYILTYGTTPIGEWMVLPNDEHPSREQLLLMIRKALDELAESDVVIPVVRLVYNTKEGLPQTVSTESQSEYDPRPWAIMRLLPGARHYTVAKFFNRQDAEDHLRLLRRFIPKAEFEILFDSADTERQSKS